VFLVSRIHEIWQHARNATTAVTNGDSSPPATITASTIMIFLFASFTLGDNRLIKLFGLGSGCRRQLDQRLEIAGCVAFDAPVRLPTR
jgi:RND superfamily putative drug exporter